MKILLVKTGPGEIVVDRLTYNYQEIGIAKAFIRKGHQCDILCCCDSVEKTATIPAGDGKFITLYCVKAVKILKNCLLCHTDEIFQNYDILQASEYDQWFTWHMSKKYADKVVVYHGPYYAKSNMRYNVVAFIFDLFLLGRYRRLNTMFLTKSVLATRYLKGKDLSNVHTIGVGIDSGMLTYNKDKASDFINKVKNLPGRKLLYIGQLTRRRNALFLLDILQACLKNGEDVALIVVGKGNKRYEEKFFARLAAMGLEGKIVYKESIEQGYMSQLYAVIDVFLLPTLYDIFGMVLLEAMYFGKPVITTVNGGSSMLIENGVNGVVVEEFDTDKWCEKIHALLHQPEAAHLMGELAHKKIVEAYTWDVLTEKLLLQYKEKLRLKEA